jgi:hypothetical protein
MRKVTAVFWVRDGKIDDDVDAEEVRLLTRWESQGTAVLARVENSVLSKAEAEADEDWDEECSGRFYGEYVW